MGTNYYRKKLFKEDDIKEILSMKENNPNLTVDDVIEFLSFKNGPVDNNIVHICKISGGCKPVFDDNNKFFYFPTKKAINHFLSEPNTIIEDEYGKQISIKDFWELIDKTEKNARDDDPNKHYVYVSDGLWFLNVTPFD